MKKYIPLLATAALTLSFGSVAQESPPYENWVGGFVQYYDADSDKPEPTGGLSDGKGLGAELGFRFDPSWAVRFELGRVIIDTKDIRTTLADDGTQIGADIMHFLPDDVMYLFGGVREQSITDSYRMAALGFGKHWEVAENWRLITELAAYHDFGQSYKEFSAKLGLAYIYGKSTAAASQPDADGDGVADALDRCPATPAGVTVDETGCNVDTDGDGVLNAVDQCPETPLGIEVDATGCNIDADGDGVLNAVDQCPQTPPGTEVDEVGCGIDDADRDGVADALDECPDTPLTNKVNSVGCPILSETEISMSLDILFPNNSSVITNPETFNIDEFAEFMQKHPGTVAEIQGHTSSVGTEAYNQALSQRRADAVKELLVDSFNIDASRLTAVGYGESRLKFLDDSAESHRLNRRIEAKVTAVIEEAELK